MISETRLMKPIRGAAIALLVCAGCLAGCGGGGHGSKSASTGPARSTPASGTTASRAPAARAPAAPGSAARARTRTSVKVVKTRYGRMLVDGRGYALYLFTREGGPSPRCYGRCTSRWPPLVVKAPPAGGSGTRSALLGTTRRRDGRLQATYAGHPLYYYFGDRAPRQVLCQAVDEFGGRWYVVAPSGAAIH